MGEVDNRLILGHGLIEICIALKQCPSAWGLMFFFTIFGFCFLFLMVIGSYYMKILVKCLVIVRNNIKPLM
jgi:hypothetical protein